MLLGLTQSNDAVLAAAFIGFIAVLAAVFIPWFLTRKLKDAVGQPNGEGNVITMLGTVLTESRAAQQGVDEARAEALAFSRALRKHLDEDAAFQRDFRVFADDQIKVAAELRKHTREIAAELATTVEVVATKLAATVEAVAVQLAATTAGVAATLSEKRTVDTAAIATDLAATTAKTATALAATPLPAPVK